MDFGRFLDILRAFEQAQVEYVLVGGVAVNLHGIVRATEVIDFVVRAGPANIERLKAALRSLWSDPEIDQIRAEDFETYPTLRYGPSPRGCRRFRTLEEANRHREEWIERRVRALSEARRPSRSE
ncbi:MAG: hypothetical protein HOP15_07340 [Planctomycetes bacterium]|nr:hypothetical protein [Planctomycetota bacterium]